MLALFPLLSLRLLNLDPVASGHLLYLLERRLSGEGLALLMLFVTTSAVLVSPTLVAVDLRLGGRPGVTHGDVAVTRHRLSDWGDVRLLCVGIRDIAVVSGVLPDFLEGGLGSSSLPDCSKTPIKIIFSVAGNCLINLGFTRVSGSQSLINFKCTAFDGLGLSISPPFRVDHGVQAGRTGPMGSRDVGVFHREPGRSAARGLTGLF